MQLPHRAELNFFHGRSRELAELLDRHDQHRDGRLATSSGPVLLAIHGRPGVGKTALAQQLALQLAHRYPDGQMYVTMGTGGNPRPPRDILHSLLRGLQWPEEEMRGKGAAELGGVFRAKTAGKRMLIVLDATRTLEQIMATLPGGNECAVITTSRANLLAGHGQHSQRLGPLTANEAGEIFLAVTGLGHKVRPDLVAEAIELCDYQPNALMSAGERARNEGLGQTVDRLRSEEHRLDVLHYGGRDVAERIASEYSDLEPLEKQALLMLTLPEAETFVPWVLQPLLEIESGQAGNLMASISRVGLLELEGRDPSGFGRYRFSSLTRLFAQRQLALETDLSLSAAESARDRFRRAYLASSLKVLARLGVTGLPSLPFPVPDHWYPQVPGWEARIIANLEAWIRADFGNLIRAVHEAASNDQPVVCWQIAARLGDCFAPLARHSDTRSAFDTAIEAARNGSHSIRAEIRVRLAKSGYLSAVQDYSAAIEELNITIKRAQEARDYATHAEALRRLGYAWQEIGYYDRALTALQRSNSIATKRKRESHLLALILAENKALREPSQRTSQLSVEIQNSDQRGNSQFIEKIILSRAACRRRNYSACRDILTEAREYCKGNLAYSSYIDQEVAIALLHCVTATATDPTGTPDADIVSLAANAVCSADRLGRPYAQARARFALAHALVRSGQADECLHQLAIAKQVLPSLPPDEAQLLTTRMQLIRGQALLQLHKPADALAELQLTTGELMQEPGTHAEALLLLGIAYRDKRNFVPALAAHAQAVEAFQQQRDTKAVVNALVEFCVTLRASGSGRYSTWRIRRAISRSPSE